MPPGRGSVKAAHGRMPLPAPGTAELLKGVPLAESTVEMELTTPTGAAILTTVVERFGPLPAMTIETIGLGAGTREIPDQANILRLFVGQVASAGRRRPRLGPGDEPRRPARRGRRLHDHAAPGRRGARRLRHADPDEEEPPGRDGDRALRRGADRRDGGDPLPRDDDAGHPPLPGQPAQAEAPGHRGRHPLRPDQGQARLARGPPADVQPRIRRLCPDRRRARRRAPRGLRRRPRRLPPEDVHQDRTRRAPRRRSGEPDTSAIPRDSRPRWPRWPLSRPFQGRTLRSCIPLRASSWPWW